MAVHTDTSKQLWDPDLHIWVFVTLGSQPLFHGTRAVRPPPAQSSPVEKAMLIAVGEEQ